MNEATPKTTADRGLAEAIALLLAEGQRRTPEVKRLEVPGLPGHTIPFFIAELDGQATPYDLSELYPEAPPRIEQTVAINDIRGFCEYIVEHANPSSRIFASTRGNEPRYTCYIDYHGKDRPDWLAHRVELHLTHSEEWQTWAAQDGEFMGQAAFVEFLEDNQLDISDPPGATMLELCQTLEATQDRSFKGKTRLDNGDTTFCYSENTSAGQPGGVIAIPTAITLNLTPFVGMEPQLVKAAFRYRLREKGLSLGFKIMGKSRLLREVFEATTTVIRAATDLRVYDGFITPKK